MGPAHEAIGHGLRRPPRRPSSQRPGRERDPDRARTHVRRPARNHRASLAQARGAERVTRSEADQQYPAHWTARGMEPCRLERAAIEVPAATERADESADFAV